MRGSTQRRFFAGLCLLLAWQSGCAAFRPMQGVPARYLPTEMKIGDRSNRRTIDLSLLRQTPPPAHLIDSGDVLGVYVEGFVGKSSDPPPVFFPTNSDAPPSFGLPHPVREDGTISLPAIGSVNVRGLTLPQAEDVVRERYLKPRQLIHPDMHRVQVNLQRPRQYRVLVIRQDSRNEPQANSFLGQLNIGMVKRGTGKAVSLPAYNNDVLNALTATDGLPGLDAENAVYIIRRRGNSMGGTLDPRWPTDLNPDLLMQQGAHGQAPIIRGQSQDESRGYLHGNNVSQALYLGPPDRRVQLANGASIPGQTPNGFDPNTPLEPPRVWEDRSVLSPMAFDPAQGQGASPAAYQQNPYGPAPGYGPTPIPSFQNNGMMSSAPTGPIGPNNIGQPAGSAGMYSGQPAYQPPTVPYGAPNGMSPGGPVIAPPMGGSGAAMPPGMPLPGPDGGPVPNGAPPFDPGHGIAGETLDNRHVIRIPIRLGPGETADIRPEDVILYDGDIVFIESRDTEVFFTGGLLGGGQFTLPRDYDLDILQALSLAQARGGTGGAARQVGGVSALNNDVSISPSTAIILRRLPDGGEVPIKVDLYRARTDLSERIVVQPGDYILLQYTCLEAVAAFFERHLLESALFGVAAQGLNRNNN